MSNPTSNFGWQMPTATDLVTDLPADFEVFGQAVDTDFVDLLGGTTGQVLSKTSGTDLDFTWIDNDTGDITGVTAGTGISGGGTSGTVTVTNSMATAFTTSGDLIQATGSGTFARLGTGTNGQYLTTNGTTNSWGTVSAGGMTLITTTTWNNTVGTYTYSSLGSYKQIVFVGQNLQHSQYAALSEWNIRFNGSSANNYGQSIMQMNGTTYSGTNNNNQANKIILSVPAGSMLGASGGGANFNGDFMLTLPDYGSAQFKGVFWSGGSAQDGTRCMSVGTGHFSDTTAITSVTLFLTSGNFESGTMRVYGVS